MITCYDDIILNRANGGADDPFWFKTSAVGGVTGAWYGFMRRAGVPGVWAPALATAGGSIMNVNSVGAIPVVTPAAGKTKILVGQGISSSTSVLGVMMLCDVLWAGSGIDATNTGVQTINSPALTRSTNGIGNMILLFCSAALGATASNITIVYVDDTTTQRSVTFAMTPSLTVDRLQMNPAGIAAFIQLDPASKGVKSIVSVQFSANMTAGTLDIMIVDPMTVFPTIASNAWVEKDATMNIDGIIPIPMDTSNVPGYLTYFTFTNSTTTGTVKGQLKMVHEV